MQLPNGWKNLKLEEIACLKAGKFIPASQIKSQLDEVCVYPCFGGNGIRGYVSESSHKGLFPIIGRQGALCGNVNLATGRFYATEHAVVATSLNNNDSLWLYYALQFARLNQYATGQAQPGLSVDTINKIVFLVPPLAEQKKIAETLSVWDSAIEKMEKQVVLQNRRFQQMLKKHIVEKIDDGVWDTCRIGDLFDAVTRKNKENCKNVLTSSAQLGLINQQEYYKKSVSALDVTGYYLLKKGEFAYNRSSSTGYPFGVVKRLDRYETGVLSTLYLCMGIKNEKTCCSDFFVYLFESGCLEKQLSLICREGARNHGLLNVSKEDFFNMSVPVPSLSEQKRIAEFMLANEKELSLLKQQLALYKKQKQGLMQKLLTGEWRV